MFESEELANVLVYRGDVPPSTVGYEGYEQSPKRPELWMKWEGPINATLRITDDLWNDPSFDKADFPWPLRYVRYDEATQTHEVRRVLTLAATA